MLNQGFGWASQCEPADDLCTLSSVSNPVSVIPLTGRNRNQESRRVLEKVSVTEHRSMAEILLALPEDILQTALTYPGIIEKLEIDALHDSALKKALSQWR